MYIGWGWGIGIIGTVVCNKLARGISIDAELRTKQLQKLWKYRWLMR